MWRTDWPPYIGGLVLTFLVYGNHGKPKYEEEWFHEAYACVDTLSGFAGGRGLR